MTQKAPRMVMEEMNRSLRAVVGQLGDLKQVAGDPAHELAGAVLS